MFGIGHIGIKIFPYECFAVVFRLDNVLLRSLFISLSSIKYLIRNSMGAIILTLNVFSFGKTKERSPHNNDIAENSDSSDDPG